MARLSINKKSQEFQTGKRLIDVMPRSQVEIPRVCYYPQLGLIETAATLGSEEKPVIEPPGLFALLSQFRQPEFRRSIALINYFLDVLGNQLKIVGTVRPQE
jgi:hypothetical protein